MMLMLLWHPSVDLPLSHHSQMIQQKNPERPWKVLGRSCKEGIGNDIKQHIGTLRCLLSLLSLKAHFALSYTYSALEADNYPFQYMIKIQGSLWGSLRILSVPVIIFPCASYSQSNPWLEQSLAKQP